MEINLIPPFLMNESGLLVDNVTSIHCGEDVFNDIHCIIVQEEDIDLQIPLILYVIFSYLPTWGLTPDDIENIDNVEAILFTSDSTS